MGQPTDQLASRPASARQLAALHAAFGEAGYRRRADRAERLAVAAGILGVDHLASFSDLTMAQAGRLFGALHRGEPDTSEPEPMAPTPVPCQAQQTATGSGDLATIAAWIAAGVWLAVVLRQRRELRVGQAGYRSSTRTVAGPKNARAAS